MSYTPGYWTCDVCGKDVAEFDVVSLDVRAGRDVDRKEAGYIGHYHVDCWHKIVEAVEDVACPPVDEGAALERDVLRDLEQLPSMHQCRVDWLRKHQVLPGQREAETTYVGVAGLTGRAVRALARAGVPLDQVPSMSDDELLAIEYVGRGTVSALRQAIAATFERQAAA